MSSCVFSSESLIVGQITITLKGIGTSTIEATSKWYTMVTSISFPICNEMIVRITPQKFKMCHQINCLKTIPCTTVGRTISRILLS